MEVWLRLRGKGHDVARVARIADPRHVRFPDLVDRNFSLFAPNRLSPRTSRTARHGRGWSTYRSSTQRLADEGVDPSVGSVSDAADCEHLPVVAAAV